MIGATEHAGRGQEQKSREKGVAGGEQLARGGVQGIHRAHAPQDHGGIEQGVDPGHPFQAVVAQDTNASAIKISASAPAAKRAMRHRKSCLDSSGSLWCSRYMADTPDG